MRYNKIEKAQKKLFSAIFEVEKHLHKRSKILICEIKTSKIGKD
jgi:hypothetical protein